MGIEHKKQTNKKLKKGKKQRAQTPTQTKWTDDCTELENSWVLNVSEGKSSRDVSPFHSKNPKQQTILASR